LSLLLWLVLFLLYGVVQVVGHVPWAVSRAWHVFWRTLGRGLSWVGEKFSSWAGGHDDDEKEVVPPPDSPPLRCWEVRASWSTNPNLTGVVGTICIVLVTLGTAVVVFYNLRCEANRARAEADEARELAENARQRAEQAKRDCIRESYVANLQLAGSL